MVFREYDMKWNNIVEQTKPQTFRPTIFYRLYYSDTRACPSMDANDVAYYGTKAPNGTKRR